jgi:hypothetical protein
MTRDLDHPDPAFDPRIADWLEADPDRAPRETLETVLAAMPSIPQRRSVRLPWRFPELLTASRAAMVAVIGVLLIGGAFLVYQRPSPNGAGGVAPTSSPTMQPSPSPTPSPTASPSTEACSLVTSDEAKLETGNFGLGALPSGSGSGSHSTCIYRRGNGDIVLRIEYTKTGGANAFAAVSDPAGVETVTGLGDSAVFDPATSTLTFLKGDSLVAIVAGTSTDTGAARLAVERKIAEIAAPRVTPTP